MTKRHDNSRQRVARRNRGGSAYLLAMIVLAIFCAMAIVFVGQAGKSLAQSDNYANALQARLAAESGVEFMLDRIEPIRVRESSDTSVLAAEIATELGQKLNGTGNLSSATVSCSGTTITVPSIAVGNHSFSSTLSVLSSTLCRMTVRGQAAGFSWRIDLNLTIQVKRSAAFDYGLASRGAIAIGGSARLVGVNNPAEASVLSCYSGSGPAITVDGSSVVSGDLSVTGEEGSVLIKGSPTIGNTSNPDLFDQHVNFGVEEPDFPLYDTAPLAALATNVVDSTTDLNKLSTVSNILIKAGTNPTFTNHMVINGIIYIEAPNNVRFEGQATVNGLIVTEEASSSMLSSCQISFAGGVDAYGVEALPDTAQYAAVKQQTGTFLLAPGFGVSFAGHVSAVNGNIAADQLTFTGSAEGVVKGSVVGLKNLPTVLNGSVDIYVDRANAIQDPAGFVKSYALTPVAQSYTEVAEGG